MVCPGLLSNDLIGEDKIALLVLRYRGVKSRAFLSGSCLIGSALRVSQGKIRLLLHAVQIFVEAVQQEGQQLLGVLLLVA